MRSTLIAVIPLVIVACSGDSAPDWVSVREEIAQRYASVVHVDVQAFRRELDGSPPSAPLILDARGPDEYRVSHLVGAKLVSSDVALLRVLARFEFDQEIVVYCSVGVRSARLAQIIFSRGFHRVRNLDGSIFEWANQGYPLVYRGEGLNGEANIDIETKQVHPFNERWGQLLRRDLWAWQPQDPHSRP